jgi:hypothetical protein
MVDNGLLLGRELHERSKRRVNWVAYCVDYCRGGEVTRVARLRNASLGICPTALTTRCPRSHVVAVHIGGGSSWLLDRMSKRRSISVEHLSSVSVEVGSIKVSESMVLIARAASVVSGVGPVTVMARARVKDAVAPQ